MSPLVYAYENGWDDIVSTLVSKGADINAGNEDVSFIVAHSHQSNSCSYKTKLYYTNYQTTIVKFQVLYIVLVIDFMLKV